MLWPRATFSIARGHRSPKLDIPMFDRKEFPEPLDTTLFWLGQLVGDRRAWAASNRKKTESIRAQEQLTALNFRS